MRFGLWTSHALLEDRTSVLLYNRERFLDELVWSSSLNLPVYKTVIEVFFSAETRRSSGGALGLVRRANLVLNAENEKKMARMVRWFIFFTSCLEEN